MILSASQLQTFARCPRLWWFDKVRRLPRQEGASPGIVYGNVLHAVLERWLEADCSGRLPSGEPLDLYPEGWAHDEENDTTISEEDQALIQQHVKDAVENGTLKRIPGQEIEASFTVPLVDEIQITGRIDLLRPNPPTIEDHKGTVSMRYALSKAKLRDNDQMLIYAKVLGDRLNLAPTDEINLAHNVFERTPGSAQRKTETKVTYKDTVQRWSELQTRALEMAEVRKAKKLHEVPVEMNRDRCNAYGGCRFLPICSGDETPKKFTERVLRLANKEEDMSLEDKLKKKGKGKPPVPQTSINPFEVNVEEIKFIPPETNAEEIKPIPAKVIKPKKEKAPTKEEIAQEFKDQAHKGHRVCLGIGVIPVSTKYLDAPVTIALAHVFYTAVTHKNLGETPMEIWLAKDCWVRRDQLAKIAPKVVEFFANAHIVCPKDAVGDQRALLDAMLPHVTFVYHGV